MPNTFDISQTGGSPATRRPNLMPVDQGGGTGLPIDDIARVILKCAAAISAVALAYILWGMLGGAWANPHFHQLAHLDRLRQLANIDLVFNILKFSSFVAVVSFLICCFRDTSVGYVLLGFTALFKYGIPVVAGQVFSLHAMAPSTATTHVQDQLTVLAWLFGIPGVLWVCFDLVRRFQSASENAAIQKAKAKFGDNVARQPQAKPGNAFSRCWELPYCREHVRVKCPVYLKRRSPCWWVKEGCMCEQRIVLHTVIDTNWKEKSKQALGTSTSSLAEGAAQKPTRTLSAAEKRERCRKCVIYNEHERLKYKVLVWGVVILYPVLVYFNSDALRAVTGSILAGMESISERFSFSGGGSGVSFLHGHPSESIEWIVIAALSLILFSQILRLVEYCCFKIKI